MGDSAAQLNSMLWPIGMSFSSVSIVVGTIFTMANASDKTGFSEGSRSFLMRHS
jgi:hypothetical protein